LTFGLYVRQMSSRAFLPAVVGGIVSALAVSAALLATGALDDDDDEGVPVRGAAATKGTPLRELFQRARRGVVLVEARKPGTPPPSGRPRRGDGVATGSGFVIDERGYVVTNDHVVAGGSKVTVGFSRKDEQDARVVGRDASTDLALLQVGREQADDFTPLPLGSSAAVRVGDSAIAIGNPLGLERTLTAGVVSATDRQIDAPNGVSIQGAVQTDAAINSGNSGGPLLNDAGEVIGVNSQGGGEGIAFAVPVDTVKDVVAALRRYGRVRRGYLGVSTAPAARRSSGPARGGALITAVSRGGPAAKAGLREGDVIVELGGRPVRSPSALARAVVRRRPGETIPVRAARRDRRITLRAELAERPRD
jgi:S1-C subfamily serine protease